MFISASEALISFNNTDKTISSSNNIEAMPALIKSCNTYLSNGPEKRPQQTRTVLLLTDDDMKLNAVVFDEQNVPSSINNSYNYNETESFSLSSSKQQSTETLSPASLGTSMSPGAGPLWWS